MRTTLARNLRARLGSDHDRKREESPVTPPDTISTGDEARFRREGGATVLVVDDETPIVEAVAYNLRKEGFQTATAGDAEQCLQAARASQPDLIILDVMLPSGSGFDVCRTLRKTSDVPIIMLTARADETDRVVGLELGADDYLVKPFSMRELIARVKSILRRAGTNVEAPTDRILRDADLVVDPGRFEARVRENRVELSPKEFDLLRFLMSHAGQVFTRQALLDRVWGADAYVEERTVDRKSTRL